MIIMGAKKKDRADTGIESEASEEDRVGMKQTCLWRLASLCHCYTAREQQRR